MSKRQRKWLGLLVSFALCLFVTSPTFAQTLLSPHYKFAESTLGQNGLQNSASASYLGNSSAGDLGVGPSGSLSYGFQGGSQTTNDPRLSVAVTSGAIAFPTFDKTQGSMATATFQVLNYTSFGYAVFITGNAPTNASASSHTIQPMATQGASTPGFEQFGLNVVANTASGSAVPASIGANPDNGSYSFAFGAAGDVNADGVTPHPLNNDYKLNDQFKYQSGDMIASAKKSGGFTNYTISYLVNVANLTPGGKYTTSQSLIVVGTY